MKKSFITSGPGLLSKPVIPVIILINIVFILIFKESLDIYGDTSVSKYTSFYFHVLNID